ncbi:MAG: TPM domain-containing protein [Thermoanaerobaculia bacterium]|nr:TPM domain-containing protein [Thermoanaerobaculia bacterium]
MGLSKYLTPDEITRVEAKIGAVEQLTSAEIRVALTRSSWMGIGNKAARLFRKYGLHQTDERTGVLILVDVKNRELLIYGDEGINRRVEEDFWDRIRDAMIVELREDRLADALITGVHQVGRQLSSLLPSREENPDELSNALLLER